MNKGGRGDNLWSQRRFLWARLIRSSSPPPRARRWAASRASSPGSAHALGAQRSRRRSSGPAGPARVDEVLMGCVLPAGLGQAPARQAARGAGLPMPGARRQQGLRLGHEGGDAGARHARRRLADIIVAGGMESMTNAPYLLAKARGGYRVGHDRIIDHMLLDGLEDAYERAAHGRLCRGHRAAPTSSPARAGCLRGRVPDAGPDGRQGGALQGRDRPWRSRPKGGEPSVTRRAAGKVSPDKIPT